MQKYRRVTLKDRIEIQASLRAGMNLSQIAKLLSFHKSTISREVKRHCVDDLYTARLAQERAHENARACRRPLKLQGKLLAWTLERLERGWSPEQIQNRLRKEGSSYSVSYHSIYRFINRLGLKKTHLHFGYKRRGFGRRIRKSHYTRRPWKLSVHDRPACANLRQEKGHWERDTIFDSQRRSVLILTDRQTRFTLLTKNPNLRAKDVARRTQRALRNVPVKTITNDNGSEFFDVTTLKVPTYFCDVLKPGQRGTVENTIGLLRRFLKRDMNYATLSPQKLKALETEINLRPRKCLDYRTPYEVFYNKQVALAV